jgi:hypothetical protein
VSQIISAIFVNPDSAERAIGALEDHGVRRSQISAMTLMGEHAEAEPASPSDAEKDGFLEVRADGQRVANDAGAITEARFGGKEGAVSTIEAEGESGLTTTTAADARRGAMRGGAVGLGVGLLAGAAALLVPGIGLVLAAGPLWAALGAAAGTSAAGAVAGGVTGYLVDQGVAQTVAQRYGQALGTVGSVVISVQFDKDVRRKEFRRFRACWRSTAAKP